MPPAPVPATMPYSPGSVPSSERADAVFPRIRTTGRARGCRLPLDPYHRPSAWMPSSPRSAEARNVATGTLGPGRSLAAAQAGIEDVAQTVAEQVQAQDRQEDRHAGGARVPD